MPTFFATNQFQREFKKLTPEQRLLFMQAVTRLVNGLRQRQLPRALRVKRFQGHDGVWEMSWADDGRALFTYGEAVKTGEPHVIWLRVGGHEIFE